MDSHINAAVDVTPYWKPDELEPYQALLTTDNPPAVMTAHVIHQALDPSLTPASLSRPIIQMIRDINPNTMIISDDLAMHAISHSYPLHESLPLLCDAGVDIVIHSLVDESFIQQFNQIMQRWHEESTL